MHLSHSAEVRRRPPPARLPRGRGRRRGDGRAAAATKCFSCNNWKVAKFVIIENIGEPTATATPLLLLLLHPFSPGAESVAARQGGRERSSLCRISPTFKVVSFVL